MERSAVSLGPTALAARDRLLADSRRPAGPGERLGAERELAERLGVSRSTIRAALADLERSGVVRRTRGRAGGIFVAERKVERDLTSLAGLPAYLRRQGFQSDARVLSTATVEADAETAAALGLPSRRARARGRARAARRRRADLARARAASRPSASPTCSTARSAGSLYELLETHYGLVPGEAEERIEVVAAGAAEARLLGLRRGAPLLAVARTAWDADGRAFERSHDLFRADRARIVVRARSRRPRRRSSAPVRVRGADDACQRLACQVVAMVELQSCRTTSSARDRERRRGTMATTKPDPRVEVRHEGMIESVYAGGLGRRSPEARTRSACGG